MTDIHVVILAAGKGTRMKSQLPKVLHRACGLPLIGHVLGAARALAPRSLTVVVGHQSDRVREALATHSDVGVVVQEPQLGTGHALLMAEPVLGNESGTLLLLSGDVPLLRAETLRNLVQAHQTSAAALTVVTAVVPHPKGYGRIVRDGGQLAAIVEEQDATDQQRAITEINSGVYAFALSGLFEAVRSIGSENAQREYYLPDLVSMYRSRGRAVAAVEVPDAQEILGVNTLRELASVGDIVRRRTLDRLMDAGITIVDPSATYIGVDVQIGADTVIHPGVTVEGPATIGSGCTIHSGVRIVRSSIADAVTVLDHCLIVDSTLGAKSSVGPFAHLRQHAQLGEHTKVGNFVELKKTVFGAGAKAGHLAYLGDAIIGSDVNIGAGTITCNYDGERKHTTTIEDGAFIGSDTQLIAPITVGQGAYVGTGTTVRENVPPGALAVSAGKQRNIDGWVQKRKASRMARDDAKR
jgi:bifunctional UDP-N-acetylglucosamine pyrophosphorylase/glucosamine-1-phosphate N-acetyltransferase